MGQTNPFDRPGKFWRGNLHTHSTRSDGALPPEEVCLRYKAEGYDFISMTDHFVGLYDYPITDVSACADEAFTTIPGAELHTGAMDNGEIWHILAVGLPADFAPPNAPDFDPRPDQETAAQIALRAREAGAFVAVAHPEWSLLSIADARTIDAAHAIEVYNHSCGVACDRGHGLYTFEQMLSEGRRVNLCATDDAHFHFSDHFGGWVMVHAAENTAEALLASLKQGTYYASTGPEIHNIVWQDDRVEVHTSAVSSVIVQGQATYAVARHGQSMTRTVLEFGELASSPWLRVTVVDAAGKRAWSNPIWRG